ncbi:hypothetical protein K493DRAFT_339630 [Basidiobolus meristosporus CBS 931.73]|uniref:Arrestin C-terminal-like domain-containing protein n=1 Tax=Basidiobolus meristosporus CBS 931.73 TaxID=1314790 RepID=A0A1Y1XZ37_9FUNG|nr:hypothetical protein K493DRAFT_339630 [Basidiobolus meristosporus CBS 931.73]|eukprot:ORX91001.1 hypothetical protein K493DRAFT_339630 [Basidiobolus meristosporus CBS 931.73]
MSSRFTILVLEDNLVMLGAAEESAGCVLRGCLMLDLSETTKLKTVRLSFEGKVKLSSHKSSCDIGSHQELLISHAWTFLDTADKPTKLAAGKYKYNFELPLKSELPPSMQVEGGAIEYKLKGVAEKAGLFGNLTAEKKIHIHRLFSLWSFSQTHASSKGTCKDRFDYELTISKNFFHPKESIDITVSIDPLITGLRVKNVCWGIVQNTSYHVPSKGDFGPWGKVITRVSHKTQVPVGDDFQKTWSLAIPDKKIMSYDGQSSFIKVEHRITAKIEILDAYGARSKIRTSLPVVIVPELSSQYNAPPRYSRAAITLPSYMEAMLPDCERAY